MSLSGLTIVADYRAAVKAKMHDACAAAIKEAADELLRAATTDVPVSPLPGGGYLRDSGFSEVDASLTRAQVAYITGPGDSKGRAGGGSLAAIVHEDTTVKHSVGHAKWLERAAQETAKRLGITIGMSIKGKMR